MSHNTLRICAHFAIIAQLGTSAVLADALQQQLVRSSQLWKAHIAIGTHPKWRVGSSEMTISPTVVGGTPYSPHDLTDAWRELDRALPSIFIAQVAAHASPNHCLSGASDEIYWLHSDLIGFAYDEWIEDGTQSQFNGFLNKSFDLSASNEKTRQDFEREARKDAAGWVLCGYYRWKRSGRFPAVASYMAEFRGDVRRLRHKWKQ